jgi:hypothetical protein
MFALFSDPGRTLWLRYLFAFGVLSPLYGTMETPAFTIFSRLYIRAFMVAVYASHHQSPGGMQDSLLSVAPNFDRQKFTCRVTEKISAKLIY